MAFSALSQPQASFRSIGLRLHCHLIADMHSLGKKANIVLILLFRITLAFFTVKIPRSWHITKSLRRDAQG
jgi:hypothetical protein